MSGNSSLYPEVYETLAINVLIGDVYNLLHLLKELEIKATASMGIDEMEEMANRQYRKSLLNGP